MSGSGYPTTVGQPEAWKESGGFAGTFSPNAAYVQTVLPVSFDNTYTAKIQWKTNKVDPGTIFAGAGPIGGNFSPTRLTGLFLPTGQTAIDKVSTLQYSLTGSDGKTWRAIDPFSFSLSFTPAVDCQVFLGTNADLFTANPGLHQDIGIAASETIQLFPTVAQQPEGWKESGGFAGTFSPNAAFEQTVLSLTGGHTYTFELVWKTNIPTTSGTIHAGAGPIGGKFSPTRLTLQPIAC